jgi:hypothetical protein
MLNLGLRYELDPPFYDSRGTNLDLRNPALYRARIEVGDDGRPIGPPAGGFVQAEM